MVFSNPWFFVFVACVLGVLAVPMTIRAKKNALALASCFFYAAWDYRYLFLLLGISVVDYLCARQIFREPANAGSRKWWLAASVVSNLGVLAYFKYTNFFLENVNAALASSGVHVRHLDILLPAGISFYTFKTMSYVIDVYRRELEPLESWLDYVTFITFFPELIAGPIVRASVFLPQLGRSIGPTRQRLAAGGSLFLIGYTKKVCADRLGVMVEPVFAHPSAYDTPTLWAATLGYTLQIYCDFSGYSDMAIGTAKAIGYDLPENFRMPYLSADIAEFWRRWHITLSSWLRDYLYIPLGGNRHGAVRTYVNLSLTMLLGGLWHGASWNFVLWGALHGVALALHRFVRARAGGPSMLPRWVGIVGTFVFVSLCWIPFRCTTFGATWTMLQGLLGRGSGVNRWISSDLCAILAVVVAGHGGGVALAALSKRAGPAPGWLSRLLDVVDDPIAGVYPRFKLVHFAGSAFVCTWVLFDYLLATTQTTAFIYFQF